MIYNNYVFFMLRIYMFNYYVNINNWYCIYVVVHVMQYNTLYCV